jgi:hypothetical protein
MKESFKLEINAKSVDGQSIECKIEAAVSCSNEMAIGVLCQLIKGNDDIKRLLMQAMMHELVTRDGKDDSEPEL